MLTIDQLKKITLGYLTGADLIRYCPAQLLISRYGQDSECLQEGANTAYAEFKAALRTRYDPIDEFDKEGSERDPMAVKIAALLAIKNILGNLEHISDKLNNDFLDARQDLARIIKGQLNLEVKNTTHVMESHSELISPSFETLG